MKVSVLELTAGRDVAKGEQVSLEELFTIEERRREFPVLNDVRWGSPMKVTTAKVGTLETACDAVGGRIGGREKVSLWHLLSLREQRRKLKASASVSEGERLTVTVEGSLYW